MAEKKTEAPAAAASMNGDEAGAAEPPEKFEIAAKDLMDVLGYLAQKPEVVLWEKLRTLKPLES